MNDLYKLYRVMLIGLIGILCCGIISGCGIIRKMAGPSEGPCSVIVANPSVYTVSVLFDGKMYWNNNFPPGHVWIMEGLEDGTTHEIRVYTADPSILNKPYRVRVAVGKTFVYDDYTGNAVVRIGGSVSSAAVSPDTLETR